jgi:hypothetical protein
MTEFSEPNYQSMISQLEIEKEELRVAYDKVLAEKLNLYDMLVRVATTLGLSNPFDFSAINPAVRRIVDDVVKAVEDWDDDGRR